LLLSPLKTENIIRKIDPSTNSLKRNAGLAETTFHDPHDEISGAGRAGTRRPENAMARTAAR
jgi:hypothetical protein